MSPKQAQSFILWMRKNGISCTSLTIGGITLDGFTDHKLERAEPMKATPPQSWQERYGGPLLARKPVDAGEVPAEAMED